MLVKVINIMLQNTYTTDDLVGRIGTMRTYYDSILFQSSEGKKILPPKDVLRGVDDHTVKCLMEWYVAFQNQGVQPLVVYEALDAIEEDVTGLPNVLLYVPIRFSHEHVKKFGEWFRNNVEPNILLTLRSDPRMAGGCGFVWNNIFYDFSFHYYLDVHREELTTLFDSHLSHANK